MKFMLASDYQEDKLQFPLIAQPKIDGCRGGNFSGILTGRSLKTHANRFTTDYYSREEFAGFDGEFAAEHECHPDLCRLTTSALSTITGEPYTLWHLFDYVVPETALLGYLHRYQMLEERVRVLQETHPDLAAHLRVVPSHWCANLEELLALDEKWLDLGYEGTIIRKPEGKHKEGRSTVREGGLLRIKRFIDAEAKVLRIIEGEENLNPTQINELGRQFRSSHQENKVPNGMVGALECELIADVVNNGKVLFTKGQIITVSPGSMTHADRLRYFQHPELIVQQIIKFKFFPKGIKDKPRFPQFQTIRTASDL